MEANEICYQTEFNIGFFGMDKSKFRETIGKIQDSSFSKEFSFDNNIIYNNKYSTAQFDKIDNQNKIFDNENEDENINDINQNIKININNCDIILDKDEEYTEFVNTKIDYFFVFEVEFIEYGDTNFLKKIYQISKGNYIFFSLEHNFDQSKIREKYSEEKVYDEFIVSEKDKKFNKVNYDNPKIFVFEDFLKDMKVKFEMFIMFQKYQVEKSIVTFKDYLYIFDKYSQIEDEKELIKLFNKFEKLSFNNDFADNTLILLQIMSSNKDMFNKDFCFLPKSLKCGFCPEELNECEFDYKLNTFLCFNCRYNKCHYEEILDNK